MAETLHMKIDRERKRKLAKLAASRKQTMSVVIRDLIDDAPEPATRRGDGAGSKTRRDA